MFPTERSLKSTWLLFPGCPRNDGFEYKILFQGPAQLALALVPITGNFVRDAVLLLMINAQALGTTEISLAAAWASDLMHRYHVLALAAVLDKLHEWSA